MKRHSVGRRASKPLQVMLTPPERVHLERLSIETGLSFREIIIAALLSYEPSSLVQRLAELEARMHEIEHTVGSHLPVIRPVSDDVK